MVSMGLIGVLGEIGLEATGIVRNVGSKVTSFQPGDRVGLFGKGLMGTRKIVPEHYCFFLPEVLSLEDAATAPCIFATANYSLITCGNLQPGQSVLIHSACGGVGLAAIQISQMVGAEIFATVGNPEKKAHLIENCGIDADHIFDSRSVSFEKDVMRMTGNKGVDLVLNSLSGELLHASWRCVAPLGKMVELGKRDFLGHAKLDMDLFNGNRTFYGVDLLQLSAISAPVLQKTIYHALKCLQEGKLRPVRPVKVFPAKDIAQAFRYMHTGKHMGRIVIQMPESPHGLPATKVRNDGLILRSDASYLLAGGLGGLGRAVARWMLEKGARHLIFMSRSGLETPKSREFVQDLESQGECQITVITGDVANMEDVRRAVSSATSPLAGVIQLSMVLNDQSFDKMTHGEWTETLAPKVQGTWNLHHATETQPLDFFIMAGSASGVMGNAGQANYAAANTFLEGFGMYRHSKGLPASVLNLGIVGDAGFVYEKFDRILELARKAHQEILEEKDILKALEIHMANGNPQLSIGLCSTKPDLAHESTSSFGHDARLLAGYNMLTTQEEDGASEDNELRALLASMKRDPALLYDPATEEKITLEIGRMVAKGTSHSDDLSPEELGEIAIDSLMTIEIRSWFRRHVNIEVSLAEISNAGTARGLGATTMRILREKHKSGELGAVKERLADSEANDVDQPTTYQEDTKLAASLQPISTSVPSWYANSEGRVFLTGSTGFMGIFFLSLLVGLPEVQQVVCLVRGPDVSTGVSRLKESSKKYGLQFDLESKVIVVPGDVSDPTFNLGQDNFEHYAQWASVVFHFAACTDYTFPYADIRRANVHGWLNVLRFSNTKRLKQVHLTSSISAYGTTAYLDGEELIPENDRPVMNNVESMQHHVGYSQSKAVVETMAWDAIANGMPVIIHRLPLVTGHSRTGRGKSNGVFSILMATSIRLGCYPTSPDARCQMVPVDFVCAAILRISQSNCGSHAFNIVQPDQAQTPTWDETMQMVAQHASPPLRRVERSEWIEAFATGGKPRFQKASSMLDESIRRIDALWQTDGMGKTLYENANFCSVLAESPEFSEWPSTPDLLSLYFKDWSNRATQW
ncbi:unnamed protein product [Penicillium salamii]|nr:unnamed protein product [Penicillium salamii]